MPMRFLQAADLQLDRPLQGIPAPLSRDVVDLISVATLTAWERLVDLAIAQDVEAVLLTGNTFDAVSDSLAADVALRTGAERLNERGIPLLVTPGTIDPPRSWDELPDLPENVTLFATPGDSGVELTERGKTLAVIVPVSAETEIAPPELDRILSGKKSAGERPFTLGLLWDAPLRGEDRKTVREVVEKRFASLDLLCCGMTSAGTKLPLTDGRISRVASPQSMTAAETGPRGATLIEIVDGKQVSLRMMPLGPVRRERLAARLEHARHRDDLLDRMLAQLEELAQQPGEQLRIVEWTFPGTAAAWHRLSLNETALGEITTAMTELTDQPGKLRTLHTLAPLWQLPVEDADINELWQDFLQVFDRESHLSREQLRQKAQELRPKQALAEGAWEKWLDQLEPDEIARRARGSGRRWFAGV